MQQKIFVINNKQSLRIEYWLYPIEITIHFNRDSSPNVPAQRGTIGRQRDEYACRGMLQRTEVDYAPVQTNFVYKGL